MRHKLLLLLIVISTLVMVCLLLGIYDALFLDAGFGDFKY